MEFSAIDCLYMFLIGGLYAGFIFMEVQISQIKTMMEEHVRKDGTIKEMSEKYHPKQKES